MARISIAREERGKSICSNCCIYCIVLNEWMNEVKKRRRRRESWRETRFNDTTNAKEKEEVKGTKERRTTVI